MSGERAEKQEISVEAISPDQPEAMELIDELSDLLAARYASSGRDGYDPFGDDNDAVFLIARLNGHPVGCGSLRALTDEVGEVKRMYSRAAIGGVGSAILSGLEAAAADAGYVEIWLETRRANVDAVAFYERRGFSERAPYGKYVGRPEAICMSKVLTRR